MVRYVLKVLVFVLGFSGLSWAQNFAYVDAEKIADAVRKEYLEKVGEDEIELEFYGGQTSLSFENAKDVKIMVSQSNFDELQNKFSADLEFFADGKPAAKNSYMGKYYVLTEVVVPAANISKGEILSADKFKTIKIRSNRIKPMHVTSMEKIANLEAKRSLKEGRLISDKDIGKAVIIKKGTIVNLVYQTKHMQIMAKAEALDDGYLGEKLEVRNTKSKRNLYGTVVDADTVRVEQN